MDGKMSDLAWVTTALDYVLLPADFPEMFGTSDGEIFYRLTPPVFAWLSKRVQNVRNRTKGARTDLVSDHPKAAQKAPVGPTEAEADWLAAAEERMRFLGQFTTTDDPFVDPALPEPTGKTLTLPPDVFVYPLNAAERAMIDWVAENHDKVFGAGSVQLLELKAVDVFGRWVVQERAEFDALTKAVRDWNALEKPKPRKGKKR
jgi:hypothetical protein